MSSSPNSSETTYPGLLVVISGPSGVGKSTICRALVDKLNAKLSISATTRTPGVGETHGRDYLFLSQAKFAEHLDRDEFLEHAQVFGHSYGTLAGPVIESLNAGEIVVLEIDVNGAKQIRPRFAKACMFFILPPAPATLSDRLNNRQRDSQEVITDRLAKADGEIRFARESNCYNHTIVNDDLEKAINQIVRIIRQEKEKAKDDRRSKV